MQRDQPQDSRPRPRLSPKVYFVAFFAVLFIFRNIYYYISQKFYPDSSSLSQPSPILTPEQIFGPQELRANNQQVDSRTKGLVGLTVGLLVILFVFRWLNGRRDEKEKEEGEFDELLREEEQKLEEIKREKGKRKERRQKGQKEK